LSHDHALIHKWWHRVKLPHGFPSRKLPSPFPIHFHLFGIVEQGKQTPLAIGTRNKDLTMILIPWVHVMSFIILCLESYEAQEYLNLAIWANYYDSSIKNNNFPLLCNFFKSQNLRSR